MAISMAMTLRNHRLDAITDYAGPGALLRLYTIGYGTFLVECECDATAFAPSASGAVLTANPIANGIAVAAGDAAIARLYQADGVTLVMQGMSVSDTSGSGDIKMSQTGTTISAGQTVIIDSLTMTEGNA
jgi:hypothetical protein